MMDMEGLVLRCLWWGGDWLPLGRVARKGNTGMNRPDFNEENETMRYVFLFVKGWVLV